MSPRRECAPDRSGELLDELRELCLAGVEGRRHDDGVATGAADVARAGIDDEPVLERAAPDRLAQGPLGRERLARRAVAHEFDPDQVAPPAHVTHGVESAERCTELTAQRLAAAADPLDEGLALDDPLDRLEEHTSELQSRFDLVCRLLLEKKNNYMS